MSNQEDTKFYDVCLESVCINITQLIFDKRFFELPQKNLKHIVTRTTLLQALEIEDALEKRTGKLTLIRINQIRQFLANKWRKNEFRVLATQMLWSHKFDSLCQILNADTDISTDTLKNLFFHSFAPLFSTKWGDSEPVFLSSESEEPCNMLFWEKFQLSLTKERIFHFAQLAVRSIQSIRIRPTMLTTPGYSAAAKHFRFQHLEIHRFNSETNFILPFKQFIKERSILDSEVTGPQVNIVSLSFRFCQFHKNLGSLLDSLRFGNCDHSKKINTKRQRLTISDGEQTELKLSFNSSQIYHSACDELLTWFEKNKLVEFSLFSTRFDEMFLSRSLVSFSNTNSLKKLSLDSVEVDKSSFEGLSNLLGTFESRLLQVELKNVDFTPGSLIELSSGLSSNTTLRQIGFQQSSFFDSDLVELKTMIASIGSLPSLATVSLDNTDIPLNIMPLTLASLANCQSLQSLSLRGLCLSSPESLIAFRSIFSSQTLKTLAIDFQGSNLSKFSSTFFGCLSISNNLEQLKIPSSRINDSSLLPLVDLLSRPDLALSLRLIDLSFNQITETGASLLGQALQKGHHPNLFIDLTHNHVPLTKIRSFHPTRLIADVPNSDIYSVIHKPDGFDEH